MDTPVSPDGSKSAANPRGNIKCTVPTIGSEATTSKTICSTASSVNDTWERAYRHRQLSRVRPIPSSHSKREQRRADGPLGAVWVSIERGDCSNDIGPPVHRVTTSSEPLGRPGNDLLSRVLRRSTIGAGAFHGRVRNGIGCSRPAKATRPAKRFKGLLVFKFLLPKPIGSQFCVCL